MNHQELIQQQFGKSICDQFEKEERSLMKGLSGLVGCFFALAIVGIGMGIGISILSEMTKGET